MSKQFPGGIISKTAPVPSGPYANSTAPGIWTLEQQAYWQKLGQWPTAGNVDPSAFIENLFSTYLYTGNGSTQTITNGIDLAGKGGLTWIKVRSTSADNQLVDTVRGATYKLVSNTTGAQSQYTTGLTSFNADGFSIGANTQYNNSGATYASWTFRKQPKFFDVVTTTSQTFSHLLASVPGCVIWKRTDAAEDWNVVSRKADGSYVQLNLNLTDGAFASYANATAAGLTSTSVTLPSFSTGGTYVAYLFAHDAGGFGLTGTDNVISCGSFTGTGAAGNNVTLGYEPQWLLIKQTNTTGSWVLIDTMRGFPVGGSDQWLYANLTNAESTVTSTWGPTATGFVSNGATLNTSAGTYIYIAIRRGPMAVPTLGTNVFEPITWTGNSTKRTITGPSFPPDMAFIRDRSAATGYSFVVQDKLRGPGNELQTWNTDTEYTGLATNPSGCLLTFDQNGVTLGTDTPNHGYNVSSNPEIGEFFRRAPGFFDVVCYTGTGVTRTVAHNLTVAPELMFVKYRSSTGNWIGGGTLLGVDGYLFLNTTAALDTQPAYWANTLPTSSVFTVDTGVPVNETGGTYVAYLFATCAGVSKVGSYTGTGALQTVNCGFTGGARFVLIKRTDSTGGWYTYDSARGITSGNDPYLFLNSTAAEVTNTNYVDTDSTGFKVTAAAPAGLNANGGTYIFLAIA